MNRCLLILPILAALGSSQANAQPGPGPVQGSVAPNPSASDSPEAEEPEPSPGEVTSIVEPTARMTTKIAFVVDTSGSMDNTSRIGSALSFAKGIIGQQGDELLVALIAFSDSHTRWPGVKHDGIGKPPPKGWTYFPGVPQLKSAQSWLDNQSVEGGTNPVSAIIEALAEPVKDLTVVLITDGEFGVKAFKKAIKGGQANRKSLELGPAVIIVIGVGRGAKTQQHLIDVGKSERGGYYVIQPPPLPTEPDIDWPDGQ